MRWIDNCRCNICNNVSHSEIASDYGGFTSKSFHPDPTGLGWICSECYYGYKDAKTEFDIEDDLNYVFEETE